MSRGPDSPQLQAATRRARRAVRREAMREYASGALWVLPAVAAVIALLAGYAISRIEVQPGTLLSRLAFHGTADDARTLLTAVSSMVVTVIALVLGLAVVALSVAQLPPRPYDSGCPECLHRHLRLQHRRSVHGRI